MGASRCASCSSRLESYCGRNGSDAGRSGSVSILGSGSPTTLLPGMLLAALPFRGRSEARVVEMMSRSHSNNKHLPFPDPPRKSYPEYRKLRFGMAAVPGLLEGVRIVQA